MTGALDGILVVSLEQAVAAPFCSQRLADAGARVIKVERAEGDFARGYDDVVHGESAYFAWLNQGKQSIAMDIKAPEDVALIRHMVAKADIFIQNLSPGAAARAGLGSRDFHARHPRLITCDISGYGDEGPARDQKAYDLLIQCEAGLASVTGTPEGPGRVGVSIADIACGMNAHAAILEALYSRARTDVGRQIEVSLFDTLAEWMAVPLLHHDYGGKAPGRYGLKHPSIAPYGAFKCGDGRSIVLSIQNQREWLSFCRDVLGNEKLAHKGSFRTNISRVANRVELDGQIGAILSKMEHPQAVTLLAAANIAYASLNEVADLSRHLQLRRMEVGSPTGSISMPARPVRWGTTQAECKTVPALNNAGAALRAEFA